MQGMNIPRMGQSTARIHTEGQVSRTGPRVERAKLRKDSNPGSGSNREPWNRDAAKPPRQNVYPRPKIVPALRGILKDATVNRKPS